MQAEDPVKLVAKSQSETEILRTSGRNPSLKADELGCPSSTVRQEKRGRIAPSSGLHSVQALEGLGDAHPCWGWPPTLLSPLIQMLIQLGTIATHPETVFNWAPHGLSS